MPDPTTSHYESLRSAAAREISDGMTELGHRVIGSWLSGEFHLSQDGRHSFSDVDVVNTQLGQHRDASVTIRPGGHELLLRVSIHANDCTNTVTRRGMAIFALLNVASTLLQTRCVAFRHYEVCKAFLVLARRRQSEPYSRAAGELGAAGAFALRVKRGEAMLMEPSRDYDAWVSVEAAAQRFVGSRDPRFSLEADAAAVLRTGLAKVAASTGDYPAWLQEYAIAKYSAILASGSLRRPTGAPTSRRHAP